MKKIINKLRIKYPQLTEKDLLLEDKNEEEFLRMIEYKLQKTKKEMAIIISNL